MSMENFNRVIQHYQFFATCPKSLESLLEQELLQLSALAVKQTVAGVFFEGSLAVAYRVCLWSRIANRILLPLKKFAVPDAKALYEGTYEIEWLNHMSGDGRLTVDFAGQSPAIRHTHFGAVKIKDAIVDQLRNKLGHRPSIDNHNPTLRVNAYLHHEQVTISVDLSGESLHRRGYRQYGLSAPLKENLAAAILYRANWPELAKQNLPLIDPLCGSGTLLIEAGLIAADIAPGLLRADFGFLTWLGHDINIWNQLCEEAQTRRSLGLQQRLPEIRGYDGDPKAISVARSHIEKAGLDKIIDVSVRELAKLTKPTHNKFTSGLIICNPPYGQRLSDTVTLEYLYQHLGGKLKTEFIDWQAAIFTGNPELCKKFPLRAYKYYNLFNGALPCRLLLFKMEALPTVVSTEADALQSAVAVNSRKGSIEPPASLESHPVVKHPTENKLPLTPGEIMFANRLHKNLKNLAKWRKANAVSCFRLYDADMPEYAVAIDCYESWVYVQEYAAPTNINPDHAQRRLQEIIRVIPEVLGTTPSKVILKKRFKQKKELQYQKTTQLEHFIEIKEGTCKLLINLNNYIDTGLFLDHRLLRQRIYQLAFKKRFLNLFCYTATATVHAALGSAWHSVSVDLSPTYIRWAKRNFALNGISEQIHHLVQADCWEWLQENQTQFELILLDPPTFSNSKRTKNTLDIQRDHVRLIKQAMNHLAPEGLLLFSTHCRQFKLSENELTEFTIKDISRSSLDKDFQRDPRFHYCFEIRQKA